MIENINFLLEMDRYLNVIESLSKSVLSRSRKFEKAVRNTRIKMQNDEYTIFIVISSVVFQ